ncbi:MAG: hypothetical protein LBU62_01365 [Bacteroidales bacterium]|jgi:hypothetical protein|nr:hypothetical protein [Bacteroidales bacterium]
MNVAKFILLFSGVFCSSLPAQETRSDALIGKLGYRILFTDNAADSIYMLSRKGNIIWSCFAKNSQAVHALPNGNILFAHYDNGIAEVTEITRNKKVVFNYQTTGEIHSCQRLKDGNTLIGVNSTAKIIEVNPQGKVVKEVQTQSKAKDHYSLRTVRKLDNGNYLAAQLGDHCVVEYAPDGSIVHTFPSPGDCFDAIRLKNGNTMISDGGACSIREVTPTGEVVWMISKKDFPQFNFDWLAGIEIRPNGNILFTNWLGHGKFGTGIPLIEITRKKKVVFQYTDNVRTKAISNVCIIKN